MNIISIYYNSFDLDISNHISGLLYVSIYSIIAFCMIFFGYILQTSLLQYKYYTCNNKISSIITSIISNNDYNIDKSSNKVIINNNWKIQSNKTDSIGKFYFHPFISNKPNRGKYHNIFAMINLIIASLYAGTTTELSIREYNYMYYHKNINTSMLIYELLLAIIIQSVLEYYWHRLMHLNFFYINFHKYHHYYKAPEPWVNI